MKTFVWEVCGACERKHIARALRCMSGSLSLMRALSRSELLTSVRDQEVRKVGHERQRIAGMAGLRALSDD